MKYCYKQMCILSRIMSVFSRVCFFRHCWVPLTKIYAKNFSAFLFCFTWNWPWIFFFVGTKSINGNNSIDFRVFFSSLHTELCVNFVNRKILRLVGAFEFLVNERLTRNLSVFFRCFSYTISTLTMSLREVTLSMYYYFDGKWNDLIRIFYEWCNVFVIHRLTASVKQRVRLKILTFNRCRYFAKQICHLNYSELTCMSSTSVLISTTQIGSDQFTSGWFN